MYGGITWIFVNISANRPSTIPKVCCLDCKTSQFKPKNVYQDTCLCWYTQQESFYHDKKWKHYGSTYMRVFVKITILRWIFRSWLIRKSANTSTLRHQLYRNQGHGSTISKQCDSSQHALFNQCKKVLLLSRGGGEGPIGKLCTKHIERTSTKTYYSHKQQIMQIGGQLVMV